MYVYFFKYDMHYPEMYLFDAFNTQVTITKQETLYFRYIF